MFEFTLVPDGRHVSFQSGSDDASHQTVITAVHSLSAHRKRAPVARAPIGGEPSLPTDNKTGKVEEKPHLELHDGLAESTVPDHFVRVHWCTF